MALYWAIAGESPLTNINLYQRDGIVFRVLHFSHWATRKTRLDVGKDFDQLLGAVTVGQVKLSCQEEIRKKHRFPKSRFNW